MDELEAALHYGLTQAKPGSAAYLLAREVAQLRPIAGAAAALHLHTPLVNPAVQALADALDAYRTGGA